MPNKDGKEVIAFIEYPRSLFYMKPEGGLERRPTARLSNAERNANTTIMALAPQLVSALREFVSAASLVEANWEGSGLAEAVRFMLARRDEATELLTTTSPDP